MRSLSEKHKENIGRGQKRSWQNPEVRERRIKVLQEAHKNPKFKEKISAVIKERWSNPKFRQMMREKHKAHPEWHCWSKGKNPKYPDGCLTKYNAIARKVWEEKHGRIETFERVIYLKEGMHPLIPGYKYPIHHQDFNLKNFAPWNLALLKNSVHQKIHFIYKKFQEWLKEDDE